MLLQDEKVLSGLNHAERYAVSQRICADLAYFPFGEVAALGTRAKVHST